MTTEFTLEEFAKQLRQLRGMKVRTDTLSQLADYFRDRGEETLARVERILAAVRPEERAEPKRVGPSEQARIAAESGVPVADVHRFFAGFERLRGRKGAPKPHGIIDLLASGSWYVIPAVWGLYAFVRMAISQAVKLAVATLLGFVAVCLWFFVRTIIQTVRAGKQPTEAQQQAAASRA
jgi:hypothetical protein